MKIIFICTAHNSLSQRLFLALANKHSVTVEYALSPAVMIEAVELAKPDLILCPFLTSRVPSEIFNKYMTLIVHPGPPGDAGPSALDWVLMGDDGIEADAESLLLDGGRWSQEGRTHWGVTVLQAVEEFDAGPVWAFEQFPINIDDPAATKSTLYRGPITRAAVTATAAALERIQAAASFRADLNLHTPPPSPGFDNTHFAASLLRSDLPPRAAGCISTFPSIATITSTPHIDPSLQAGSAFRVESVTLHAPFLGGQTRHRPLLKAAQRDFDVQVHTAREISRRIRSSDSQPGCLTRLSGGVMSLYVYGGVIEDNRQSLIQTTQASTTPGSIIACRDEAVCIATCDGKGVWLTHVRRLKRKADKMLWPKVPAVSGLRELRLLDDVTLSRMTVPSATVNWSKAFHSTYQDVWVDFSTTPDAQRFAYVHFDFYNGAMSTSQCSRLLEALQYVASTHTMERQLSAVVLMGGPSYFSNGIALNVIEASADPAVESWQNINRIDDVVQLLLQDFSARRIKTVAAIRGNCAAGGVAMAAACDVVIAGSDSVLNPAYRALGLHGSEYHSLSYTGRCGTDGARRLLHDMLPLSADDAASMGLVDHVLPFWGTELDEKLQAFVQEELCPRAAYGAYDPVAWKQNVDLSHVSLAAARATELGEMAKDFWSARSSRYHNRRRDFVRKIKATRTPLRFATHRRAMIGQDEEESAEFDDVQCYERRKLDELLQRRLLEMEKQEPSMVPATPVESSLCAASVVKEEPMVSRTAVVDEPSRNLEPVFSCYYSTTTC